MTNVKQSNVLCSDEFAWALQTTRDAVRNIEAAYLAQPGELPELWADQRFTSEVFAQILMQHLTVEGMKSSDKRFWMEVGEYMGPDWIASFKHVGGFMSKVGEF